MEGRKKGAEEEEKTRVQKGRGGGFIEEKCVIIFNHTIRSMIRLTRFSHADTAPYRSETELHKYSSIMTGDVTKSAAAAFRSETELHGH